MIAGRYTQVSELGRGGMGVVWRARDEVLGREVALKQLGRLAGADHRHLERAEREARLAASLNHPHVVAVYDLVHEGDSRWLVMELVEGSDLGALAARRPLGTEEAAGILAQIADALATAHSARIVHRDVKPSNILVDRTGHAKLTDFGIARMHADAALTQTGLVTGSPAYLAPEIAAGGIATTASDVWALGATLFHALSGRPPYDVRGNVMGAMYQIVHDEPPRLAGAGRLGPLLEATMCRSPEERWTMTQVRDYLTAPGPSRTSGGDATRTQVLQTTAVAPPVSPPLRPVPRHDRSRRAVLAAGLLAALLVVGGVVGGVAVLSGTGSGSGGDPTPSSSRRSTGAQSPVGSASAASPSGEDLSAAIESFVRGYLLAAVTDSARAWTMLTPKFQRASGGFGSYTDFWGTIASAEVRSISADPGRLRVRYQVAYTRRNGSATVDDVTLQLVRQPGGYLIAGES